MYKRCLTYCHARERNRSSDRDPRLPSIIFLCLTVKLPHQTCNLRANEAMSRNITLGRRYNYYSSIRAITTSCPDQNLSE